MPGRSPTAAPMVQPCTKPCSAMAPRMRPSTMGDAAKPKRPSTQPITPRMIINRSEEHTSELQSLMRISYAVFCLKKKKTTKKPYRNHIPPTDTQLPLLLHRYIQHMTIHIHTNTTLTYQPQ